VCDDPVEVLVQPTVVDLFASECVDEKIKELVLVDFTVCLLVLLGHSSASGPFNLQAL
jgi:hypothetical protein